MLDSVSKLCSDHLRQRYPGLKASHARELVAAYFGYKSHAALLADKIFPVDDILDAKILIPDWYQIQVRRECLRELSSDAGQTLDILDEITEFLQAEALFTGEVWQSYDVGEYVLEEFLPQHLTPELDVELDDLISKTNSFFEDAEYDAADVEESTHGMTIRVTGTYVGISLGDSDSIDESISLEVFIHLPRWAGRIAYDEPEMDVHGVISGEADTEHRDSVLVSTNES